MSTASSASVRAVPTCSTTTSRPSRRSASWTFVLPDRPWAFRTKTTSGPYRPPGCVNHAVRNRVTCRNSNEVSDLRSSGTSQEECRRRRL